MKETQCSQQLQACNLEISMVTLTSMSRSTSSKSSFLVLLSL